MKKFILSLSLFICLVGSLIAESSSYFINPGKTTVFVLLCVEEDYNVKPDEIIECLEYNGFFEKGKSIKKGITTISIACSPLKAIKYEVVCTGPSFTKTKLYVPLSSLAKGKNLLGMIQLEQ